jgi:hypothetical protein
MQQELSVENILCHFNYTSSVGFEEKYGMHFE